MLGDLYPALANVRADCEVPHVVNPQTLEHLAVFGHWRHCSR